MFFGKDSYQIFISYERTDAIAAGLFYIQLKEQYGEGFVFKDMEETVAGTKWPDRLRRLVQGCKAFVLIIVPDWQEKRVIKKLNDPNNWVHREIVTAVEANKLIFPVVVQGASPPSKADVPSKISQAIHDRHHFLFRQSSAFWEEDIKRLCAEIEQHTGITGNPSRATSLPGNWDHVLCRLNRHGELGTVAQGFQDGQQIFVARGSRKAGFGFFALRCAVDVVATGRSAEGASIPRYESLQWGPFADPDHAQVRRTFLLKEIAKKVFTDSSEQESVDLEVWVKERIRCNLRPTVIYSVVTHPKPESQGRIQEWLATWRELLAADQAGTMAVLLFVESSWWPWARIRTSALGAQGVVVCPAFGKITRDHWSDWLNAAVPKALQPHVQQKGTRLYCFPFHWRKRHFEDIRTTLQKG